MIPLEWHILINNHIGEIVSITLDELGIPLSNLASK